MAYENQEKCLRCGKSIPQQPEDAAAEERLCDLCYEEITGKDKEWYDFRRIQEAAKLAAELHDRIPDYEQDLKALAAAVYDTLMEELT